MKKLSAYLFLFLFGFSAPSFADDIRDLEIGGMSLGDSLLDYFSEKEILTNQPYLEMEKEDIFKTVSISCYDWSSQITEEKKWYDNLRVTIETKEYTKWLSAEDTIYSD